MSKAANTQQRYCNWWQVITGSQSDQDQSGCCKAESVLPCEGFGTAQTPWLHSDRPNLKRQGRKLEQAAKSLHLTVFNEVLLDENVCFQTGECYKRAFSFINSIWKSTIKMYCGNTRIDWHVVVQAVDIFHILISIFIWLKSVFHHDKFRGFPCFKVCFNRG